MSNTVKTNSRYTYINFANDAKILATGGTIADTAKFLAKADDLIATNTKKADYNATNPKKTAPKGASEATRATADNIMSVLGNSVETALTASEINEKLGTEYTALNVANAAKFIEGIQTAKVIRTTTNAKGLTAQKEYTGYFVG